jgi:hypothetical protein
MEHIASDIKNNLSKIDGLLKYCNIYNQTNKFFYEFYSITPNIISIDVITFNLNFLKFINKYIKSNHILKFIDLLENSNKHVRVVKYGILFKALTEIGVNIKEYMFGYRNLIFKNFFSLYSYSSRNIQLYRINYDDIEFSSLSGGGVNDFVDHHFIDIVKFNIVDYIITLNKSDGVFYIKDKKIIDIKYTSGWVNIPIYKMLLTEIVLFLIDGNITMKMLNDRLSEIVEYTSNDKIFGYQDCNISNKFAPDDNVPSIVKNMFIANTLSKFIMLFNRI